MTHRNELKHFSTPFEFKADDDEGTFSGHASIFNKEDSYSDIVLPGAFKNTLAESRPGQIKMLRGHDTNALIGVWDELKEDKKGLFVKGRLLLEIEAAKETFLLLKAGVLDSMSIGFRTIKQMWDDETETRSLIEIKLFEISLVTFPAQPDALVSDIKSLGPEELATKRELESALRDAGFSNSTSKFICAGWTPPALRNVEGETEKTVDAIQRLAEKFKQASGV